MDFGAFPVAQPFQQAQSVNRAAGARDSHDDLHASPSIIITASVPESEQKSAFPLAGITPAGYNAVRSGRANLAQPYSEDHIMERPGEKLKRIRERLKLTYRDVEKASQQIAERRGSDEFAIALSRLADIENKGTVPTIYRLYTLCAIYRQDLTEVLRWYGVPLDQLASEALHVGLDETHAIQFKPSGTGDRSRSLRISKSTRHKTTFLSYLVRHWGKMPLSFLDGLDLREYRYGLIGLEDWSMYPILQPGSLVAIDESRRKIASSRLDQ